MAHCGTFRSIVVTYFVVSIIRNIKADEHSIQCTREEKRIEKQPGQVATISLRPRMMLLRGQTYFGSKSRNNECQYEECGMSNIPRRELLLSENRNYILRVRDLHTSDSGCYSIKLFEDGHCVCVVLTLTLLVHETVRGNTSPSRKDFSLFQSTVSPATFSLKVTPAALSSQTPSTISSRFVEDTSAFGLPAVITGRNTIFSQQATSRNLIQSSVFAVTSGPDESNEHMKSVILPAIIAVLCACLIICGSAFVTLYVYKRCARSIKLPALRFPNRLVENVRVTEDELFSHSPNTCTRSHGQLPMAKLEIITFENVSSSTRPPLPPRTHHSMLNEGVRTKPQNRNGLLIAMEYGEQSANVGPDRIVGVRNNPVERNNEDRNSRLTHIYYSASDSDEIHGYQSFECDSDGAIHTFEPSELCQ